MLDHVIALDALARFHLGFWQVSALSDRARHARHFALFFGAYVEKLSLGLALVDRTINRPQFEKLFDEGSPELGIAPGAYKRLKWNVVHVEDATAALAAHGWKKTLDGPLEALKRGDPDTWGFLLGRTDDRYQFLASTLVKRGIKLFGGNTVDIGKDTAHVVWFPVQAEVAEQMGDTRVHRIDESLVSEENTHEAVRKSEPGDILVERRNWYLSNVGLPGFWPHAALYLGTKDELAAYFADPDIEKAYGGPFARHLEATHPAAWGAYVGGEQTPHGAFPCRLIEAVSEGVVFTSAEHSIGTSDYVAAMRPRLSKLDKARAIDRAFSYYGRPYDFDFDFDTDAALVCSELVYKAYEPRKETQGVKLPLERVVGRMTLGPNTMVRQFDADFGTPTQALDFAWFLDGHERQRSATFAAVDEFRKSHQRPKWDVMQQ